MPRPLDEILGLKKTASVHDFEIGDAIRMRPSQISYTPGATGIVTGLDEWNRLEITLDGKTKSFPFHHSHVQKI